MNSSPDQPLSESTGVSDADPVQLRREVWRLRDQVFGLEAERSRLESALLKSDAERRAAQYRADALDAARAQRDAMLESTRWKIGGAIVRPSRFVRRFFSRGETRS